MKSFVAPLTIALALASGLAHAQWITISLPGTPRNADGTPDLQYSISELR